MSIKKKKEGSRAVGQSRRSLNYKSGVKHPRLVVEGGHGSMDQEVARAMRAFKHKEATT